MKVIEVVGAILMKNDKFLIVLRHPNKPQPLTWGIPSGKVELNESNLEAVAREISEETEAEVDKTNIEYIYSKEYDFSKDGYNVNYHVYRVQVPDNFTSVVKNLEHIEHRWVTPQECLSLENLIDGLDDVIKIVFRMEESRFFPPN